jgi:hypothetical protein
MRNFIKLLISFILIVSISGCSSGLDVDAAKTEVDNFHKLMDIEAYSKIYENMASILKDKGAKSQTLEVLSEIKNKLGKYKEIKFTGWQTHKTSSGSDSYIVLTYNVTCEHGSGTETFHVVNENNNMRISFYNMGSDDLFKPA